MNHQEAQNVFLDFIDGQIDAKDAHLLQAHLDECPSCNQALAEYQQTIAQLHDLRARAYPLTRGFGDEVMEQLSHEEVRENETKGNKTPGKLDQRTGFLRRMFSGAATIAAGSITVTIAGAIILIVLGMFPNLGAVVDGLPGASLMMFFALMFIGSCIYPIYSKRSKLFLRGGLLTACLSLFVLRSLTTLFFGADYGSYSGGFGGGGGGGGSFSMAAPTFNDASYDDSLFRSGAGTIMKRLFGRRSEEVPERPQPDYYSTRQSHDRQDSTVSPPPTDSRLSDYGSLYQTPPANESYANIAPNDWTSVAQQPVSTFAADIDTGSYTNIRRFLRDNQLPPASAVRVEEMVNYFQYRYPAPEKGPIGASFEIAPSPFDAERQLLRVGLRTKDAPAHEDRGWNLVFLVDVSGSMADDDKLPLLKQSLKLLVDKLRPEDRISIVTYANSSSVLLQPTSGADKQSILPVIDRLRAAGSTNGGDGINTAYQIARANLIPDGVNRVILATDGDFNVGVSSYDGLMSLIEQQRKSGVTLTSIGVGKGNLKEDQLEQLADRGNGNFFYLDSLKEAQHIFGKQLAATVEIVAKDVKLQLEFNPARIAEYRLVGFENRAVAENDFTNDTVDGGEMGSGHTVTALYEVRFTTDGGSAGAAPRELANELGFLKVRYKDPAGDHSVEQSFPITAEDIKPAAQSSEDFKFAAAVAAFGDLLRGAPQSVPVTLRDISRVAGGNISFNPDSERSEFLSLVNSAQTLAPNLAGPPPRRYGSSTQPGSR